MIKTIYTIVVSLLLSTGIKAQRMISNQKGLEITAGILAEKTSERNYFLNIGWTINTKNGNYKIWTLEYMQHLHRYKNQKISQETYTIEGGYSFNILGDKGKNLMLNLGITGILGYENINKGKAVLSDGARIINKDQLVYGLGTRLTVETYLSDEFTFIIQGRSKIFWGTDLKQFRPTVGIGLRFNF